MVHTVNSDLLYVSDPTRKELNVTWANICYLQFDPWDRAVGGRGLKMRGRNI